jgi:two-component system NtrC family sensor kinase
MLQPNPSANKDAEASVDPQVVSRPGASFAKKGTRILVAMVSYLLIAAAGINWERGRLWDSVVQLEAVHVQEEQQLALNLVVSYAILTINANYLSNDLSAAAKVLTLEVGGVVSQLERFEASYGGELGTHIARLNQFSADLQRNPSRTMIADLREEFHQLVLRLDNLTSSVRTRKANILKGYRDVFGRLTVELLLLMIVGVAIIGGVSSIFFRQLSRDIGLIKLRASEIVRGYRGAPLLVTRDDELGVLMSAVNDMEAELRSRESELELNRQQRFHTEKMAAVGTLAAAVAHEINNPLAAIVGLAESLVNERKQGRFPERSADHQIDLILYQARRVMTITHQIGEFSLQRPLVPAFVDLNALVRSTCTFISFDKRFRGIALKQDLAAGLPALFVVSDYLVQILMNLLINAADALEGSEQLSPSIVVGTRLIGNSVVLEVTDNGPGIASENIGRVFDPHFTTKPPGRGSGLGLSLCRNLVEQDGGGIEIESVPGQGAKVRISLPVPVDGAD